MEVVVNLISATTTEKGLHIQATLDFNDYPIGLKASDEELKMLHIKLDKFHGEWNYVIRLFKKGVLG